MKKKLTKKQEMWLQRLRNHLQHSDKKRIFLSENPATYIDRLSNIWKDGVGVHIRGCESIRGYDKNERHEVIEPGQIYGIYRAAIRADYDFERFVEELEKNAAPAPEATPEAPATEPEPEPEPEPARTDATVAEWVRSAGGVYWLRGIPGYSLVYDKGNQWKLIESGREILRATGDITDVKREALLWVRETYRNRLNAITEGLKNLTPLPKESDLLIQQLTPAAKVENMHAAEIAMIKEELLEEGEHNINLQFFALRKYGDPRKNILQKFVSNALKAEAAQMTISEKLDLIAPYYKES